MTPILNVVLGALKKVIAAVNALAVQPVENIVYDGVLVDLGNVIRVRASYLVLAGPEADITLRPGCGGSPPRGLRYR